MPKVLNLQHKINGVQMKNGATKLLSMLFLVDDFIDQASFAKHNSLLNALYIKARLSTTIRTVRKSKQF